MPMLKAIDWKEKVPCCDRFAGTIRTPRRLACAGDATGRVSSPIRIVPLEVCRMP